MDRWIAIIVLLGLVWFMVSRGRRSGHAKQLDEQLFRLCRGDQKMMDRLVALESRRVPGRSHRQAVSAAIAALKRDRQ